MFKSHVTAYAPSAPHAGVFLHQRAVDRNRGCENHICLVRCAEVGIGGSVDLVECNRNFIFAVLFYSGDSETDSARGSDGVAHGSGELICAFA